MLMLIWHRHRVLPFVSGSKVQKADAPKSPHCDSIVAICHAYGLRTVDISVTRLKWLQGKRQSLVAFSAPKKKNMQQTFWNARIEEFDAGFLKDWKGWWSQSKNQPGKSFGFFVKKIRDPPCFFWELKIESSWGGKTWKTYPYKYQVHSASSPPVWIAPHHPRLDHRVFYPFEMTSCLVRFENGGFS